LRFRLPRTGDRADRPTQARVVRDPTSGSVGRHPRNAVHTPRRIPLVSSRTASLRPLPSCGYHMFRPASHAPRRARFARPSTPPGRDRRPLRHRPKSASRGESPRAQPPYHRRSHGVSRCLMTARPRPKSSALRHEEPDQPRTEQARPASPPEGDQSAKPARRSAVDPAGAAPKRHPVQVCQIPWNPALQPDLCVR